MYKSLEIPISQLVEVLVREDRKSSAKGAEVVENQGEESTNKLVGKNLRNLRTLTISI